MLRSSGNDTVRTLVTASSARSRDICQRYATGLYRHALLTPGDSALAEDAVRVVIADECTMAPAPGRGAGNARYRLAESVRASSVLGICPGDMTALLRTALLWLATSSKNGRK